MPYARSSISGFELGNPLYVGASVAFYTVDVNGVKTSTLANLYASPTGTGLLPNPQTLDSLGKFTVPVYIQDPVIGTITPVASSEAPHDTGIISNPGRWRGPYATATLYYPNDLIQDPGTGIVYAGLLPFLSTSLSADITAGNLEIFLTPADLMAAINAAAQATAAAASASAAAAAVIAAQAAQSTAATSASNAATSATASATSATASASSATAAASSASAAATSASTAASAVAQQIKPQGRLSLSATLPVQVADISGAGTIYYLAFSGNNVPVYNGSSFISLAIGAGISQALDSNSGHTNYHQTGKLFDVFAFSNSGSLAIGTGPAWSTTSGRGTGAGTTELERYTGLMVNKNSIDLRKDAGALTTVAVRQATYLGTFYTTADGQTTHQFGPLSGAGGAAATMGLYNAYNRVRMVCSQADNTATWTYATASWRASNASLGNAIRWIDGMQESFVTADFSQYAAAGANAFIAIGLNSDTVPYGNKAASLGSAIGASMFIAAAIPPALGFNGIYSIELVQSGTTTFSGDTLMNLRMQVEM